MCLPACGISDIDSALVIAGTNETEISPAPYSQQHQSGDEKQHKHGHAGLLTFGDAVTMPISKWPYERGDLSGFNATIQNYCAMRSFGAM